MSRYAKYNIKITVEPSGNTEDVGVEMSVTLEDVNREDIMKPDYGNGGITAIVKEFERAVGADGE